MAILKCKMCGADLTITTGESIAECEYCGTKQTLPTANEEVIQKLFNRANTLRLKSEFDKAEQIYEKIINENDTEAEAHWGIVLCKYGIEYVEDPKTYKRVPTCHRTSYDAVITDADYIAAIEHADELQRKIYEEEAKAIDEIQRGILHIVKDEKPYDVFICYKETDENGKRTIDSTIANDIYYQLNQENLKVFYAAITLEDKLGREYEPYIFAALNSAKVMLVIGTKPEYYTAVWVKNEWSRFLKLMKQDRTKLLIPCYRDMDAYDLPEEFAHLQAQDMNKIGFINDIVRGIRKVISEPEKEAVTKESTTDTSNTATNTAPLLRRVFMFLEDGDFASADEYCEKVLDIEPECAEAYLGKLMAEFKIKERKNLKDLPDIFDNSNNYKKAYRFGDDELKKEFDNIVQARNELVYNTAVNLMNTAKSAQDYHSAKKMFKTIINFKDSENLHKKCIELYEKLCNDYELFGKIYEEAVDKAERYYNDSSFALYLRIGAIKESVKQLEKISHYRDSQQKAEKYKTYIKELEQDEPKNQKSGCYVATAVYGSYDCPQVWTLRRYRDYTLAKTWYGRAFIRTYYAISPTLVKWFGHTEWFKKMWQKKLDHMVADLQEKGFESTPYVDRKW